MFKEFLKFFMLSAVNLWCKMDVADAVSCFREKVRAKELPKEKIG